MHFVIHEDVAASRETIWGFLADPANYRDFMDGLTGWSPVGETRSGVGTRSRVHMRIGPAQLGQLIEVVEFDPPADLAWIGVAGVDHRGRWRLRESEDGRTHVQLRITYHTQGGVAAWLADWVASPIVERRFRRSVSALKRRVEEG